MARSRKRIACRFCGAEPSSGAPESKSHFDHSHPAHCPFVTDRVPALNGVHVGDLWQNDHTGGISRVEEIRLGGSGTYVDREPCVLMVEVWEPEKDEGKLDLQGPPDLAELATCEPDEKAWVHEHTLWSLVEHSDPLTRPGEYPVPWTNETKRGYTSRWAADEWRCPGYRGGAREDGEHAYWHAFHTVKGYGIQWEKTNVLWQVDLEADPTLVTVAAEPKRKTVEEKVEPQTPADNGIQEALF